MERNPGAGFLEVEHTADRALDIWAPDIQGLLQQAAMGLNYITQTILLNSTRSQHDFQITIVDLETLLVDFLSELLYLADTEGIAFDGFDIKIVNNQMIARLSGAKIASQEVEIKAVTFHNLKVHTTECGFETQIVFDL